MEIIQNTETATITLFRYHELLGKEKVCNDLTKQAYVVYSQYNDWEPYKHYNLVVLSKEESIIAMTKIISTLVEKLEESKDELHALRNKK